MRGLVTACAALLLIVVAVETSAQQLLSRQTKNLNLVYYDKNHEYLSYHLARSFENSLAFHRKLFGYTPSEPVLVLMQDFGDYGHGGTSTLPWNFLSIGIEPFDYVYDTMPANERMNWLMHHELMHVVATDQAADGDLRWRKFFRGKVAPNKENPLSVYYSFLTTPRWYCPRWYHEGIAVFLETWMAGGIGRVLGGYDEMVFRTMVAEDAYFYDVVGLESEGTTIDFQVGQNSYLYGTRFVTYLAATHGPDKLVEWFSRSSGSKRYFSAQFRKVFGRPLEEEWRDWIKWERDWQKQNLARIREYHVTPATPVGTQTLGSVSRSFYDRDRGLLYAAINRPATPAQIVSIDVKSGAIKPLTEVTVPSLYFVTSLAYDAKGRKIFYTTDNSRGWRDLNELDLETGRRRELLKDARTGDLVVNPADQSIWGVQHNNGLSSLVVFEKPYTAWKRVLNLEYGRDIFDIDISPDGKTLSAAMIDVTGRQRLIALDLPKLLAGDSTLDLLHEFESNTPANFVFSPDGRYLYGTSYYTGVSNVWRFDRTARKMEALTNVETGVFRPIPIDDDRLLAFRYSAKGFTPVTMPIAPREDINAVNYLGQQVVEKYPVVKSWNAGSPARVNLDEVTTYQGPYNVGRLMRVASIYPVVEGYKDTLAVGARINLADPLALHTLDVTAAVSPNTNVSASERFHVKAAYDHSPWSVRARWNATDFYDLFGPTKTSRKGYSASLGYHRYLIFNRPRLMQYRLNAAYYGGLETLPEYQNVAAPFSRYASISGTLEYQDLRKTIGAVDHEKGHQWSAGASGRYVNGETFPRLFATYDRGFLLPADHTSLWLRTAAGKSFGDRDNPFGNFYFGAFGNNWVDYREVRRYRDMDSFPGLKLNEAGGSDFLKGTAELALPPIRFQKLGIPGLYSNWARFAFFTSALTTGVTDRESRSNHYSAGVQGDLSLVMFSNLESTFSVGYAKAFGGDSRGDEIMVSLRLLR